MKMTENEKSMKMTDLENNVIHWAKEKGIFEKATKSTQFDKTQEEITELKEAITQLELLEHLEGFVDVEEWNEQSERAYKALKDAIGDIIVTLVIQAKMNQTSIGECLELAWNEIKDRKGKMINGTFVKE